MRNLNFALLGVAASLLLGQAADAHTRLVRTTPTANGIAVRSVDRLTLEFSDPVELRGSRVQLRAGGHGLVSTRLVFSADRRTLTVIPAQRLGLGTYQVSFSATHRDGHTLYGVYDFIVVA